MTTPGSRAAAPGPARWRIGPSWTPWLFLLPGFVVLFTAGIYPVVYAVWASLHAIHLDQLYLGTPFSGLGNYGGLFTSGLFLPAIRRTFVFLVLTLPAQIALGLIVALLLSRRKFGALRSIVRVVLVVPIAMTTVVVGLV